MLAFALDVRAPALDDGTLPRGSWRRCSLAVAMIWLIVATTDADLAKLLDCADAPISFEALRGLVRRT